MVTETLTTAPAPRNRLITETYNDVVNGALVTVERVTNIAADGTKQVADTIKEPLPTALTASSKAGRTRPTRAWWVPSARW